MEVQQVVNQRYTCGEGTHILSPGLKQCALDFYRSPESRVTPCLYRNCHFDGSKTFWAVKFSFEYQQFFERCSFIGGSSGLIDVCRGGDLSFKDCTFVGNSRKAQLFIRGGAKNIVFENCKFISERSFVFSSWFVFGSWSLFDFFYRPYLRNIEIKNCTFTKGCIMKGISMYSEKVKRDNSYFPWLTMPCWMIRVYWKIKRRVLKNKNIPLFMSKVYPQEL